MTLVLTMHYQPAVVFEPLLLLLLHFRRTGKRATMRQAPCRSSAGVSSALISVSFLRRPRAKEAGAQCVQPPCQARHGGASRRERYTAALHGCRGCVEGGRHAPRRRAQGRADATVPQVGAAAHGGGPRRRRCGARRRREGTFAGEPGAAEARGPAPRSRRFQDTAKERATARSWRRLRQRQRRRVDSTV